VAADRWRAGGQERRRPAPTRAVVRYGELLWVADFLSVRWLVHVSILRCCQAAKSGNAGRLNCAVFPQSRGLTDPTCVFLFRATRPVVSKWYPELASLGRQKHSPARLMRSAECGVRRGRNGTQRNGRVGEIESQTFDQPPSRNCKEIDFKHFRLYMFQQLSCAETEKMPISLQFLPGGLPVRAFRPRGLKPFAKPRSPQFG
jgi:hypothetical protein